MALVTFVNDSAPYLNAENLNNNFQKHILTASLGSNHTLSASSSYEKLNLVQSIKIGSNLEMSSGGIKCLETGNVKISAKMSFNSCGTGLKWLTIYKNSSSILALPFNTSTARISLSIPSTLESVSANDIIYLEVSGASGDVIRSDKAYTEMTIEYV